MNPQQTTKELTPAEIFKVQHEEWLKHPMTRILLKNLEKQKIHSLSKVTAQALDFNINDAHFRCVAYGAATIDLTVRIISSTEAFLEIAEKQ